ncbi:MAG: M23 family metallopeptidase [Christensenellales bacterium]|jgi:murein DD-endopeptidase MepM/ murein hydrolase activator NlpD
MQQPRKKRRYLRLNMSRRTFMTIVLILMVSAFVIGFLLGAPQRQIGYLEINPTTLENLLRAQNQTGIAWQRIGVHLLGYSQGLADETPCSLEAAAATGQALARQGAATPETGEEKKTAQAVEREIAKLSDIAGLLEGGLFPLEQSAGFDYANTWGAERTYGGDRKHEGIDIFAESGTPIRAVAGGKVISKGWLELGGWQIEILAENGVRHYYAHMSRYAENINRGDTVEQGAVIGYVGDTGYGPEGTTGQFEPHLHFGLYDEKNRAFNPYPYLLYWNDDL